MCIFIVPVLVFFGCCSFFSFFIRPLVYWASNKIVSFFKSNSLLIAFCFATFDSFIGCSLFYWFLEEFPLFLKGVTSLFLYLLLFSLYVFVCLCFVLYSSYYHVYEYMHFSMYLNVFFCARRQNENKDVDFYQINSRLCVIKTNNNIMGIENGLEIWIQHQHQHETQNKRWWKKKPKCIALNKNMVRTTFKQFLFHFIIVVCLHLRNVYAASCASSVVVVAVVVAAVDAFAECVYVWLSNSTSFRVNCLGG